MGRSKMMTLIFIRLTRAGRLSSYICRFKLKELQVNVVAIHKQYTLYLFQFSAITQEQRGRLASSQS